MAGNIIFPHEHNKGCALFYKRKRSLIKKPVNLPFKRYPNLRKSQVDRVDSALEAAANFSRKEVSETEEDSSETEINDFKTKKEYPKMKKNPKAKKAKALKKIAKPSKEKSFAFRVEHEETSEEESEDDSSPGTSRKIDSETFNIAISKRNYRRMRTALKLLDFVEGNDDDNESDWSMNSTPSSSVFFDKARIGAKRSTRRLEAMQDLSPKDYFGFCKDCRTRCRSCGRRPSAVAKTKK